MKAAYIEKVGKPEEIIYGDLPKPVPESNQILIKVLAVAVNPIDTYIRSGLYPMDLDFPFIIGGDAVGIVEEVGSFVEGFKKGDRVWTCSQGRPGRQGTFAEYIAVDQDMVFPLPGNMNPKDAVAVIFSAMTGTAGIILSAKLRSSETIFVNGGGGSIGSAVIQLAKAIGSTVIASAGSAEKVEWCKKIGADFAFDYHEGSVEEQLLKQVPYGVDVYWETSRAPNLELAVRVLGERGRIVVMAAKKDYKASLPVNQFYNKQLSLNGFTMNHATPTDLGNYALIVNRCMAEGKLTSKIAIELPLKEAAKAHKIQEEEKDLWGKIILVP